MSVVGRRNRDRREVVVFARPAFPCSTGKLPSAPSSGVSFSTLDPHFVAIQTPDEEEVPACSDRAQHSARSKKTSVSSTSPTGTAVTAPLLEEDEVVQQQSQHTGEMRVHPETHSRERTLTDVRSPSHHHHHHPQHWSTAK